MFARMALPLAAGLAAAPLLVAGPASAATNDAQLTVVHGVPGLTVDIYADGKEILSNVEPGSVSSTLTVPAGSYDLKVFKDGDGPNGTPALEADGVDVAAGANATVAAYLSAAGDPTLKVFANDTSAVPSGQARVTVRHTAAAPAVDVRAGEKVVFADLTNGGEESTEVPAGTISADVVLAGTDTVAIGPADLPLGEGTSTVVYAWGDADAGYKLLTQEVAVSPQGVDAGEAGLADSGAPVWAVTLAAVASLTALTSAGVLVTARRRRIEV